MTIGSSGVSGFPRLVNLLILLAKPRSLEIHVPIYVNLEGKGLMLLLDELAQDSEHEDLEPSLLVREGLRQKYSCCDLTSSELNGRVGRY